MIAGKFGSTHISSGQSTDFWKATSKGFGRHAAYYPDIFERIIVTQSYFKIL